MTLPIFATTVAFALAPLLVQRGDRPSVAELRKQALGRDVVAAATAVVRLRNAGDENEAVLLEVARKRRDWGRSIALAELGTRCDVRHLDDLLALAGQPEATDAAFLSGAFHQHVLGWAQLLTLRLETTMHGKDRRSEFRELERAALLTAIAAATRSDPAAAAGSIARHHERGVPAHGYTDLAVAWAHGCLLHQDVRAREILAAVASEEPALRMLGLTALSAMAVEGGLDALLALDLPALPAALRWRALEALSRQSEDGVRAEGPARVGLTDEDELARVFAAHLLSIHGRDLEAAAPVLFAGCASAIPQVRAVAVGTLDSHADPPERVLDALGIALRDRHRIVRSLAVDSLARLAPTLEAARPLLRIGAKDSDEAVRAAAQRALEALDKAK